MNTLHSWLKRPYPMIENPKIKWILVLSFGLFVWFFLNVYQPFGATEIKESRWLFLGGFGASVSISLSVTYLLTPKLFPSIFKPGRWTIKREILYLTFSFLLVSISNYLYNSIIGATIAPQHTFWQFLGITLAVGIFPVLFLVFMVELYSKKQNGQKAMVLRRELMKQTADSIELLTLRPETKKAEPLIIRCSDFAYAESDNNYTTIFFFQGEELRKRLMRLSIKKMQHQISSEKDLVRCHRSYIINKRYIVDFSGNARALYLRLRNIPNPIPVSRNLSKTDLQITE